MTETYVDRLDAWRDRALAAEAERDEARRACEKAIRERRSLEIKEDDWHTAYERSEARVTAHERTASLACDLLNALQPWGLQSPEVRSAATRLTVALAALTPPSEAAALAKEDTDE